MSTPTSPMPTSYTSDSYLSSITDPTDFPQKSLQFLDTIIRCPICKEYFKTPTIGECGHIYCSFCVMKTLAIERNCPVCKKNLSDSSLFKSITTEKIVNCWENIRNTILKGVKEEYRKKKAKEYIRRSDTKTFTKNKSTGCSIGKDKLECLRISESTHSPSEIEISPSCTESCIQQ